ncbi:hypothetical protein R3P38DRAFT_3168442 [Favolaschia claudopus]|uniref:Sulfhydryl oxidase n=1 Tax=Favolaschia claudopus TaxID=2862362 RepID=A0AAW0E4D6_9AGAR
MTPLESVLEDLNTAYNAAFPDGNPKLQPLTQTEIASIERVFSALRAFYAPGRCSECANRYAMLSKYLKTRVEPEPRTEAGGIVLVPDSEEE